MKLSEETSLLKVLGEHFYEGIIKLEKENEQLKTEVVRLILRYETQSKDLKIYFQENKIEQRIEAENLRILHDSINLYWKSKKQGVRNEAK